MIISREKTFEGRGRGETIGGGRRREREEGVVEEGTEGGEGGKGGAIQMLMFFLLQWFRWQTTLNSAVEECKEKGLKCGKGEGMMDSILVPV